MRSDLIGHETPAVVRVHWADESFSDFCFLNDEDFSFNSLLDCINNFASFKYATFKGVDALNWNLIRKFEAYVRAARPCSATFRFSGPTRRPEIVMWHFAKNRTSTKLEQRISEKSCHCNYQLKDRSGLHKNTDCTIKFHREKLGNRVRSSQIFYETPSLENEKENTVSFLMHVVSHITSMKNSKKQKAQT
jgi:hypothetical protein